MNEIVRCTDLCKSYGQKEVLRNLTFTLERGKIIGLLGPNGSGKTTLMKLMNGLLQPTDGEVLINGMEPGVETKKIVSYLPDKMYFADWMKVNDLMDFFSDFYEDFQREKAEDMCQNLGIALNDRIKRLSKGNKEKFQLILVMSRQADLYLLDEPIGGVDPAARDYILEAILANYNEQGTILISTHLVSDVEKILDEVVMIRNGELFIKESVDDLREESGKSVDGVFREMFHTDVFSEKYRGGGK